MLGHIHTAANGTKKHVGGCRRPKHTASTHPHLFRSVLDVFDQAQLPTPPSSLDYYSDAMAALSDIDGNGEYGDCVCAWIIHMVCALTAAAGNPVVLGRAEALALYAAITGFNPNDPNTDQGTDPIAALQYLQKHGIDGKGAHKIAGWLTVPANNPTLIRQMLTVFGPALMMWLELPDPYEGEAAPGATWDVGTPNPNNGHCIGSIGFVPQKLAIDTWGLVPMYMTDAAVAELCTENAGGGLVIVLTEDWINKAKQQAPSGLDMAALTAILDQFGGNAPPVAPPPPPPPVPPPPVPPPPVPPIPPPAPPPANALHIQRKDILEMTKLANPDVHPERVHAFDFDATTSRGETIAMHARRIGGTGDQIVLSERHR